MNIRYVQNFEIILCLIFCFDMVKAYVKFRVREKNSSVNKLVFVVFVSLVILDLKLLLVSKNHSNKL